MKKREILLFLSILFIVSSFIGGIDAYADIPTVAGEGTLTSLEDDGTVIIDEKGYILDPSATILDSDGNVISLDDLSLPAKVRFEYVYKTTGFLILYIEELKEEGEHHRRRR
jgi:hypothetical protein